jgi:hypothetical protein
MSRSLYAECTSLEFDLALQVADASCDEVSREALASMVAAVLAGRRRALAELVRGILRSVEAEAVPPAALLQFAGGWTPTQVHELLGRHRALVQRLTEARALIDKALADPTPG